MVTAPGDCCKPWADLPARRRTKWGWQVLHAFAHSRVPFTVDLLAERGAIPPDAAAKACAIAVDRDWLYPADSTGGGPVLYVGRLAPRRH